MNVPEGRSHSAYSFLSSVADEVQIEKAPIAVAVSTAVRRFRQLLENRQALTTQQEVGLFGELLFLSHLIHTVGVGSAYDSWIGFDSEEHDFAMQALHAEIKTTTSERRRHTINGIHQLVPPLEQPLALISIQLTRTTRSQGQSLTDLVSTIRRISGGHAVDLDHALLRIGWSPADADLYQDTWSLRSRPRAYLVTDGFPSLTPEHLALAMPRYDLLTQISYTIDLTDYEADSIEGPVSGFID
ncbi:PD-(D/E)XK motif protein [Lolliginicoccus lacisalsi]|uniref:PD-(D/E)XK motif protein n=1 Tax=Lolliginicoccus lacisalsi TaxID=2742202 RepID=UPI002FD5438E